jgi:hypothetical protein
MKSKWFFSVLSATLLAGAVTLSAQEPPPPPGPPPTSDALMPGGPMRGRMEILGFGEMHPGKVVTGAPYSAVAVTESKQTLPDGNTIYRKVQANVFRDTQGRTRRETSLPAVGPLAASGQPKSFVMLHDPVTSSSYVLHPDEKVVEKLPGRRGGSNNPDKLQNKFESRMQQEIADGTLKKEDLGTQIINGVSAQGTRYTRTIPVGQIGNEKAITIVSETWYSPELQLVVKKTHNDPRFGESTYTLTNIQRQEPAASLFTVPADYTVKQGGPHGAGRKGLRSAPSPGTPPDMPPPPPNE